MLFPDVKRVVYEKNPLDNVICQLQFPAILKIDSETPFEFQELIRKEYPILSESSDIVFTPSIDIEKQIPSEVVQKALSTTGIKNYQFSSEDGFWKINLTRNFMALSTNNYKRWEEFEKRLEQPFKALTEVYSPSYYTRIGLRYIDVIVRSSLGLDEVSWRELINNNLLGLFAVPALSDQIMSATSLFEFKLDDENSNVRLSTRTVKKIGQEEVCYMIDTDLYKNKKTENENVLRTVKYFNTNASKLIQWCIKGKLHKAMEPREID